MKIRNYLFLLGLAVLITSCNMNAKSLQEPSFSGSPSVKTGDIWSLSYKEDGDEITDYYCFTSPTEGTIITSSTGSISTNPFEYDEGQSTVNGQDWLTFIYENNCIKAFNKKNAYVREAGKEGLYATFANNGVEITLSSNGKASIKTDSSTFSYKYTNDNGVITFINNYETLEFLYFSEGYLVYSKFISLFTSQEKIQLKLVLDTIGDTDLLPFFKNELPDNFTYSIQNVSTNTGNHAKIATMKELLNTNPDKSFYFTSYYHPLLDIDTIPDNAFEGCKNLYGIYFGNVKTSIKFGKESFKNCTNLQSIDAGDQSFGSFGESAFEGCSSLKGITIYGVCDQENSEKYCKIGKNAFKGCTNLYATFNGGHTWTVTNGVETKTITSEINKSSISDLAEKNKENAKLLTETYVDYEWKGTKKSY